MLLSLVILVVGATAVLWSAISTLRSALELRFERQDEVLDALSEKLDRLQDKADELEYRSLTPGEKEHRRFKGAHPLTVSDVERIAAGQTLHLISCSYHYPSEEPDVHSFEYKHERLGEPVNGPATTLQEGKILQTTKPYVPVQGLVRWDAEQDWTPYTFLSSAEESVTRDHAGTIRRL